jgi:hypothetical protein
VEGDDVTFSCYLTRRADKLLSLLSRRSSRGKFPRFLTAIVVVFSFAATSYADPIKYTLVNATFADGGSATGYVVYETRPAPQPPLVTDWAITVIGGVTGIPRFAYDPTNSTVSIGSSVPGGEPHLMSFGALPSPVSTCSGQLRRIQFDLLRLGALAGETCQTTRRFVAGGFQRVAGPVLSLKAYNQHPASRVVFGGSGVTVTLDMSPAGWTTPLNWYFAIVVEGKVYWVTASGLSLTPTAFARFAPALVSNAPVLFTPLNGNTQTTFVIIATDASGIVAWDYITVLVPPSPSPPIVVLRRQVVSAAFRQAAGGEPVARLNAASES